MDDYLRQIWDLVKVDLIYCADYLEILISTHTLLLLVLGNQSIAAVIIIEN